jgi:hypothetical protein
VTEDTRRRSGALARWLWAVPVVLGAAVVFGITSVTYGECYDSATDPDASYCTSGPMVGAAGVWVLWILWGMLAAFCVYRIARGPRRE